MKALVFFLAVLLGSASFGQTRYGYVDFEKAVEVIPEYHIYMGKFKMVENYFLDSLKVLQEDFQGFFTRGGCGGYLPSPPDTVRLARADSLFTLARKKIDDLSLQMDQEFLKLQSEYNSVITGILFDYMKRFNLQENVYSVLWKEHIWYCEDCHDFTDEFIAFLKQ